MKTNTRICPLHFCLPAYELHTYSCASKEHTFFCPKCRNLFLSDKDQIIEYGNLKALPNKLKSTFPEDCIKLMSKNSYGFSSQSSMSAALGNWNKSTNRLISTYLKDVIKGKIVSELFTKKIEESLQKQKIFNDSDRDICFDVEYLLDKSLLDHWHYAYDLKQILKNNKKYCQVVAKNILDVKKEICKISRNNAILRIEVNEEAEFV